MPNVLPSSVVDLHTNDILKNRFSNKNGSERRGKSLTQGSLIKVEGRFMMYQCVGTKLVIKNNNKVNNQDNY